MKVFTYLESITPAYVTPNRLSWSRIFLVPIIWATYPIDPYITLFFYAAACLTDWYDGYLARKRDIHAKNGKRLDEVSDKILVVGMIILLFVVGLIPIHEWSLLLYCIAIILIREAAITALREIWPQKAQKVGSHPLAKLKTFLLMPGLGFLTLGTEGNYFPMAAYVGTILGTVLIVGATILAIVSAVIYVQSFRTTTV